jgi:NADH-quinone oxidoreductase subunit J
VAGLAGLLLLLGVLIDGLLRGQPVPAVDLAPDAFSVGSFAVAFMADFWVYFALTAVLLLVAEIAASAVIDIRRRGQDVAATQGGRGNERG